MMKPQLIRINDVSDIDTSKISVFDLNNRYIDKNGNMYGVKYNPAARKIEVIRIVRAVDREVSDMRQRIAKKRLYDFDAPPGTAAPMEKSAGLSEETIMDFDPENFINDSMKLMQTHRERIKGIVMNIKNSNVFPRENKQETIELENVFRNLEIDGDLSFDHADNYQKELRSYPRSITYYQAKIDNRGNQIIEKLAGDQNRVMKFIYKYEMFITITGAYKTFHAAILELRNIVEGKNIDDMKGILHNDKQAFQDAKISINNTITETEDILDRLSLLERYVTDSSNF